MIGFRAECPTRLAGIEEEGVWANPKRGRGKTQAGGHKLAWEREKPLRMGVRRREVGEPGRGGPRLLEGQVGRVFSKHI